MNTNMYFTAYKKMKEDSKYKGFNSKYIIHK